MRDVVRCEDRLKNIIVNDKQNDISRIEKVIKSEIIYVLKDYLEIDSESVYIELLPNENCAYTLNFCVDCKGIKIARTFPGN